MNELLQKIRSNCSSLTSEEEAIIKAFFEHREHKFFRDTIEKDIPLYANSIRSNKVKDVLNNLIQKPNNPIATIKCSKGNVLYYTLSDYYLNEIKETHSSTGKISPEMFGDAKDARDSLNRIFREEKNTIYTYIAITSHTAFPMLPERVENENITVFLMSDKNCLHHSTDKKEWQKIYNEWTNFILSNTNRKKYVRFYLVNNHTKDEKRIVRDKYRFLYTSLLTRDYARFNYYQYEKDGVVRSGVGELLGSIKENNSLYDIVEQEYTQAWNERIGVYKIKKWGWLGRIFINKILWIIIALIVIVSAFYVYYIYDSIVKELISNGEISKTTNELNYYVSTLPTIITIAAFVVGIIGRQITKFFKRQKLEF